jgi:hypothetical protein
MDTDRRALRRELELAPTSDTTSFSHRRGRAVLEHAQFTAPPAFRRAEPVEIALDAGNAISARLRYRHVLQSEAWSDVEMRPSAGQFVGTIPASVSASTFPLMYYAIVTLPGEEPILVPGLGKSTLAIQPYEIIHSDS